MKKLLVVKTSSSSRCFDSAAKAAAVFGVPGHVILERLARGWSSEAAVGIEPPPPKPQHYKSIPLTVIDGKRTLRFSTIKNAAAAYEISAASVRSRLKLQWTPEQSLGIASPPTKKLPSNSKAISVIHNGRQRRFKSIGQAARAFNLRPALVHKRWRILRWPLEEALEIRPHSRMSSGKSRPVRFMHRGKRYRYRSILEASENHGINHGTVLSRLTGLGWTIQQALGLASPTGHSKQCYGFIYLVTHRASGRQYVGQTLLAISQRWEEHVRTAEEANPHGPHLRCTIRKHGRRAFRIEEIDQTNSFHDANVKERQWIKKLGTLYPSGSNMTRGGGGTNLGHPVTARLVKYASISEAARAHGLRPMKVTSRLTKHGWTIEQALGLTPPPPRSGAPIKVEVVIEGKKHTFPSIKSASRALRKDYGTVRSRLQTSGWTIKQALDLEPPPKREPREGRKIRFTYDGQKFKYNSLAKAALEHGVDAVLAGVRINKLGWNYAQAFSVAPPPKMSGRSRAVVFTHNGKTYRYTSRKGAAEAHGLKRQTVNARVCKSGWSYAEALGVATPPDSTTRPDCAITFTQHGRRHSYNSISHAAEERGLLVGTVSARIRSGYTVQQALGLVLPPRRGRRVKKR